MILSYVAWKEDVVNGDLLKIKSGLNVKLNLFLQP